MQATDVSSNGFGKPWGHTRSFASRLSVSETLGNGFNWQVSEWPYLVIDYYGDVAVLGRPNEALWFDWTGSEYVASFSTIKQTLTFDSDVNRYRLTDVDGSITEFQGGTGHFLRHTDSGGNTTTATGFYNGINPTQVERQYTADGSTTTEQLSYEYDEATGDALLARVTLRRKVDDGVWSNVARATYSYYGGDELHGLMGDLRTATTQTWDGAAWVDTGTTLYRYYTDEQPALTSSGSGDAEFPFARLLKYVVNPASYDRLVADPEVTDPLTASDAKIALYADNYFEYDTERRVTVEIVHGGTQMYTFDYDKSGNSDGYNRWKYKTTETLPDGSQNIVYANFAGQTMLRVFRAASAGSVEFTSSSNAWTGDQWCEFYKYDSTGQMVLHANPSAVSGYDEQYADLLHEVAGNYEYLKDHEGLVNTYQYHSPSGYVSAEKVQQGELGTPIKLHEYEYVNVASPDPSAVSPVYLRSRMIVYPNDVDQSEQIVTAYTYSFHPGTYRVRERVTTLPVVPTEQNGSGVADTRREVFDLYGNLTWVVDERGFISHNRYDIVTGALVQHIADVDTSLVSDAPTGWQTPAGGGLHLITDYEHDARGRITQQLGPEHTVDLDGVATTVRRATWTVYKQAAQELWSAQGYATPMVASSSWPDGQPDYSYTLVNPVAIRKLDKTGKTLETIRAIRSYVDGELLPTDTFPQSSYARWTTYQYSACCSLVSQRVYHSIPVSGEGSSGTNYDETEYGYDSLDRQNRVVSPGGTITRAVFDVFGRAVKTYIGTNDTGATDADPAGGGASGNNMVLVTEYEYDNAADGGDGNLTKQTQYVDDSTTRVTAFVYDWRNRRTDTDGEVDFYEKVYHDNLDRPVRTERHNTTASGKLVARSETKHDTRGRVYQTLQYGVDPATGTVGNVLVGNTWFDAAGNRIKELPAGAKLFKKTVYDAMRQPTHEYKGFDLDETAYADASSVVDDMILEQTERVYDDAGNLVQEAVHHRYHNATGVGALQGPSGNEPKSRGVYSAAWHDPLGRTLARADYGTHGGTPLERLSIVPARSDTVLVHSTVYDAAGNAQSTTNPGGITTRVEYDAVGRRIRQILNYQPVGTSSSSSGDCAASDDVNITVETTYNADGNVSAITAINPTTGNQTTQYVYGTTLVDSGIATSVLKRAEIYPDSADVDDRITFKYNRQRDVVEIRDQQGTVHVYDYDKLGRQTQDRVTVLGEGVDGTVRRIGTTYEVRGMKERITSYDDPTVGSDIVDNEVLFTYNPYAQLVVDYQEHEGAVSTTTSPKVEYGYANGADNTIRPASLTYPNGRVLTYAYGEAGGTDDVTSRIAALVDSDLATTHLAEHSYLGLNTFVEVDYPEPNLRYTLVGTAGGADPDTGDIYRGLDRFGHIKDSLWYDYGRSQDVDRIKYGYDRNGNRLWRENTVDPNSRYDELYGYDAIDRLNRMDRGELAAQKDAITNLTFAQCWGLDATGNWRHFSEDRDGTGWDLVQERTSNAVNEITDVHETLGEAWITPLFNRAGNMTRLPKPSNPTQFYLASYDAWNRLVRVQDATNVVAEYAYDGAKRRVMKKAYMDGVLDETRHFYYSESQKWQVLEERLDGSLMAERQFVLGHRYIDDLVLRDQQADGNGSLAERLYAIQDANWNMTAVTAADGVILERTAYTSYGKPLSLTPSFLATASSLQWETYFAGDRWDVETDSYQVRHRVIVPGLNWVQRDPLGLASGINLYEYVKGNPIAATDPFGLMGPGVACLVGGLGASSVSAIIGAGDWWAGDKSLCQLATDAICDGLAGCLVGLMSGLSLVGLGGFVECVGLGALIGTLNQLCKAAGRWLCSKMPCEPWLLLPPGQFSAECFLLDILSAALFSFAGCFKPISEGVKDDIAALLGIDAAVGSGFCGKTFLA